jgi:galactonate dehydratase
MRLRGPDPHGIGGSAREVEFLYVRVDTDSGLFGIGEAPSFPGVEEVIRSWRPWLVGRDPLGVRPLARALLYGALPVAGDLPAPSIMSRTATQAGPPAWGLSGVEMALCDLAGKALGQPVSTLLGGAFRDRVRVYLDRSGVASPDDLGAWTRLAERTVADGFDFLKFDLEQVAPELTADPWNRSLGTGQIECVVERLGAARDAAGWNVEIALDGHMCFDVDSAIRVAQRLEPLRLRWLEDPIPITSADSLADVRRGSGVPICAGEMFTAEQFRQFAEAGAIDVGHPDLLFAGGLHETRRVADLLDLFNLPFALHNNGSALNTIAAAHVAAASPNALGLEYHFFDASWVGQIARRERPLFESGGVVLDDARGFGAEFDADVCRRHLAPNSALFD